MAAEAGSSMFCSGSNEEETNVDEKNTPPISLARSLACLPEEDSASEDKKRKKEPLTRIEIKRLLEKRIKKRVKNQFSDGKFHSLMDSVISQSDTLQDAYDIIRAGSNVDLVSSAEVPCFRSVAGELADDRFRVAANTISVPSKRRGTPPLVLPNLKLRTVQEALRVSLETVHWPTFSKLSHGGRGGGRGHTSALNFVSGEMGKSIDWWFTLPMDSPVDDNVISKLIAVLQEKIEDRRLSSFVLEMFQAGAVNLCFGRFPKGQGLPQEGVLSSVLMNIYLHELDQELEQIFMKKECQVSSPAARQVSIASCASPNSLLQSLPTDNMTAGRSRLREWIRGRGRRFNACRVMDEVLIAGTGPMETGFEVRDEVVGFLQSSLFINPRHEAKVVAVDRCPDGLQFLGMAVRVREEEQGRAVHKLRDKVRWFCSAKKDAWEALMVWMGKKWLARGLLKVKESEIPQLKRSSPTMDRISMFRKEGMETDHWFKVLLKVWMQDVGGGEERNEAAVLRRLVAEPAMPKDLLEAYREFMWRSDEYFQAEEKKTLELLSQAGGERKKRVVVEAPMRFIRRRLVCYRLMDSLGKPRCVRELVLQDDDLILQWFRGLVHRWRAWFAGAENLAEIESAIAGPVRRSCVRTLAAKHKIAEAEVERKLGDELATTFLSGEDEDDDATRGGEAILGGICLLSLAEKVSPPLPRCIIAGCPARSSEIYAVRQKESQSFPGWKTGFSPTVFSGLKGARIPLCKCHVSDLYAGRIGLSSVDFDFDFDQS
ncbi:intron maturase, type II family protein isoform X2 [Wolffia australiana]